MTESVIPSNTTGKTGTELASGYWRTTFKSFSFTIRVVRCPNPKYLVPTKPLKCRGTAYRRERERKVTDCVKNSPAATKQAFSLSRASLHDGADLWFPKLFIGTALWAAKIGRVGAGLERSGPQGSGRMKGGSHCRLRNTRSLTWRRWTRLYLWDGFRMVLPTVLQILIGSFTLHECWLLCVGCWFLSFLLLLVVVVVVMVVWCCAASGLTLLCDAGRMVMCTAQSRGCRTLWQCFVQ